MGSILKTVFAASAVLFFGLSLKGAEKILIAGSGWNQIMLVDKASGKAEWVYDIPQHSECNGVAFTKDKKIFYSNKKNARLVNADKETVWEYPAQNGEELHTAMALANGNFLVAIAGKPARIVELDKNGRELKVVSFDTQIENVHGQFRQACKTKKNTYLLALLGRKLVVEIDQKGRIVNEVQTSFPVFSVRELANDNWLLSGDGGNVQEVNPKTKEAVRRINNGNLNGAKLLFATEAAQLKNGNIMVANWNGHSEDKGQPKLLEIDKNNNVVWSLKEDLPIKNISAFHIVR